MSHNIWLPKADALAPIWKSISKRDFQRYWWLDENPHWTPAGWTPKRKYPGRKYSGKPQKGDTSHQERAGHQKCPTIQSTSFPTNECGIIDQRWQHKNMIKGKRKKKKERKRERKKSSKQEQWEEEMDEQKDWWKCVWNSCMRHSDSVAETMLFCSLGVRALSSLSVVPRFPAYITHHFIEIHWRQKQEMPYGFSFCAVTSSPGPCRFCTDTKNNHCNGKGLHLGCFCSYHICLVPPNWRGLQ